MKQAEAFLQGEGAAWLDRNLHKLDGQKDPIMDAFEQYKIHPGSVLEIGCANGWRLNLIKKKFGCHTWGIDPCAPNKIDRPPDGMWRGTASNPGIGGWLFDTVIYGWCLYLCDPEDYLKIAYEGDSLLREGGFLIIYDFCTEEPYKVPYKHKEGIFSHHYDFSKLWLSHPAYSLYGRTVQDDTVVTILKKNLKDAFPVEHE